MKTLRVKNLLPVLEGRVVRGNDTTLIRNVAKYMEHQITDHTLVFVMKKRKSFTLPENVKSCTVVTSDSNVLKGVTGNTTVVRVRNVRKAYMRFTHYYRNMFDLPVIGVTGTCGKTTVKEMITWMLSEKQNVVSTVLSRNGLRRNLDYLISIDDSTDAAVFEMGVSGPDQLLYSAHYFQPQIGIITTIGTDHIEGFKSQDAYFNEKAKMVRAVGPYGTIIINADDENSRKIDLSEFKGKVIYYGINTSAHFQAHSISFNQERKGMDFTLRCRAGEFACFIPGFGTHNVYNALAALAGITLIGANLTQCINRLNSFTHVRSHLEFHKGINGSTVIDDTWNANPTSIDAALEVLTNTANGKKTIAVIGEIDELGTYSVAEHEKVGASVVKHDVDMLITVGELAIPTCRKAAELGMNPKRIFNVTSQKELYRLMSKVVGPNTSVLIKASMRRSFGNILNLVLADKE